MNGNTVSDRPPTISILRILGIVTFGYIVLGNVVALLVVSILYEGNLVEAMTSPQDHPEVRNILLIAQGVASLVGLILIPWLYLKVSEQRNIGVFFKDDTRWLYAALMILIATIAFGLAISPITEWNANWQMPPWMGALGEFLTNMEKQAAELVKVFTKDLTISSFGLAFVVVAILPALGEELVFRGLIQTELQRVLSNPHVAIWLAAAFFSAFHLQFFGFFPRILIGAFLGYLYYWSGNLWLPILSHFFNNGVQLTLIYLNQNQITSFDMESTDSAPLPVVFFSIAIEEILFDGSGLYSLLNPSNCCVPSADVKNTPDDCVPNHFLLAPSTVIAVTVSLTSKYWLMLFCVTKICCAS